MNVFFKYFALTVVTFSIINAAEICDELLSDSNQKVSSVFAAAHPASFDTDKKTQEQKSSSAPENQIKTGDILLLTGTNSYSFATGSRYTHVGMFVKDDSNNLFVFESSFGFSEITSSYDKCTVNGKVLNVTTADGLRLIALEDIKRFYDKHKEKWPVTYSAFTQTEEVDVIHDIENLISSNYQYPKSFWGLLPCVIPFFPKLNSKKELFCSEAIATLLLSKNPKITGLKENPCRYKPHEIVALFPYNKTPIALFQ